MTSLAGCGGKPPSTSRNQSFQLVNSKLKSMKVISTGMLKRLKDASVADCKTSMESAIDFSYGEARTFRIQPFPTIPYFPEDTSRSTSETWSMIINNFEQKYTGVYIQSDMKKKAHLDCFEGRGGKLVHEPKEKWCHVLLLDAMVHSAHHKVFSPVSQSSARRRKFNQHLELRNSILEHYGMSTSPNTYDPQQCSDGHVTPDSWDSDQILSDQLSASLDSLSPRPSPFPTSPDLTNMDYDTLGANTVSPRSNIENVTRKRKFTESSLVDEDVGDMQLCENMYHLLSESHQTKFENDIEDFGNFGFSKRPPHPWDSHESLRNYLLSLAGTGKSSKRFAEVVNDLCRKLATHGTDVIASTNTFETKYGPQVPIVSAMIPTSLMDIVALVIGKVVDPSMLEYADGYPSNENGEASSIKASIISVTPSLGDYDFYSIEPDSVEPNEIKSHYSNFGCGDVSSVQSEYTSSTEHMRAIKIENTSNDAGSVNDCNSGVHFIIPANPIHLSEENLGQGDLGDHVVCGAQCKVFAKVPSPLFRSSDIYCNPTCQDFAYSSFTEMWDENYEV